MKRAIVLLSVFIVLVAIVIGCNTPSKVEPDANQPKLISTENASQKTANTQQQTEKVTLKKEPANAKPLYSNPQAYQVTRTLAIKNDTATVRSLRVWMPNVVTLEYQKDISSQSTSPNVTNQWKDQQADTSMSFWEFSNRPAVNSSLTIIDQFTYTCYAIDCTDFPEHIASYDKSDPQYTFFTQPEKYIESDNPRIIDTAKEIVGNNTNPVQTARLLYDWVINYLSYKEPLGLRGAKLALENKWGNCGDYSALFVALCRATGIPARPVVGRWATSSPGDWHVWAEFYVPECGWVPADATNQDLHGGDNFGHIDNRRLVFNKQYNVTLHPSPQLIPSEFGVLQAFIWEYEGFAGEISADLSYIIKPVTQQ